VAIQHLCRNDRTHGKNLGPNDYSPHKRREDAEAGDFNTWRFSPIDEVNKNLFSTGYPQEKTTFVNGTVEETIPDTIPAEIALLRPDTDFYESTHHELQHLFPRLSPNGVLIIDDYGWWRGSRDATDQYFAANDVDILLHRVDSVSRVAVKPRWANETQTGLSIWPCGLTVQWLPRSMAGFITAPLTAQATAHPDNLRFFICQQCPGIRGVSQ